ncbi:MAG TPA: kelch repeat-containing protein [Candidatus Dormibacteraeota bacterium]|nr:kelch repeat-containing protein [Candidatus Dormibacteraeota bacterium]
MAYDSNRNLTVLFGGYSYPGYLQDTWEWNGSAWTRNFTAHTPPPRDWSAMSYDSKRHVMVLFGGLGAGSTLLNDTWEYDGTDWKQVLTPDAPSARRGMALAFDPIRGKTVLFGGENNVDLNDTWEYDGTDWTQVTLAAAPPIRIWHSMAYDAALDGVVVFGGVEGTNASYNDTWIYDGTSWQQINSPNRPIARFWASMAYDSAHGELVLFGGGQDTLSNVLGDTWLLSGINTLPVNWAQSQTSTTPAARAWPAMDYDSARGVTVMFGGSTGGPGGFQETWEWDGFHWVLRTPQNSPPALNSAVMAYDSRRHVSVLFGGETAAGTASSQTWEWDGTYWTQRSPAVSPPARTSAGMVYDSSRGVMVLFGGTANSVLGDTWQYDGTTWTQMSTAVAPSARFGPAMAFDSARARTVLFGGEGSSGRMGDTWEWDGTAWSQRSTAIAPYARFWASMAFDSERNRTVLFGGDHIQPYDLGPTNDTWEWDGSQWTRDWTSAAPAVRAAQAMSFDSGRERMVLFGGNNAATSPATLFGDTWELGSGTVSPAGNAAVSTSPSSLDLGSIDISASSTASPVYVTSSGTGPLAMTMSTTGDFAISSTDCPSAPDPLAPGTTCLVFVTFSPTAAGDRYGSLTFTGNFSGGSASVPLHGLGLQGDFAISANPSNISMVVGAPNPTSAISTTAVSGAGTVTLSALTTDPGITATFVPTSVAAGSGSTMTIVIASSIGPGIYGVRAVGTEGGVSHYVDITVHILPPADFTISISPATMSFAQGSGGIALVSTTAVGSGGTVSLSTSVSPAGPIAVLDQASVTAGGSSTLTVSSSYALAPGSYTVTITGVEGSFTHQVAISITVTQKGIVNGRFETDDLSGWTQAGFTAVSTKPHTGSYSAQLGSATTFGVTSTLSQTFTVPSSANKLTFWYWTTCSGPVKNDWFTVTLNDGVTGTTTTLLAPVCSRSGGWKSVTVNLSAHAGDFVTLTFTNHDGGVAKTPTLTLVDDVAFGS